MDTNARPDETPRQSATERIGRTQMSRESDATVDPAVRRMPGTADVIAVHRLALTYGRGAAGVEALRDISFRIRDGEFVVVVGPSGCGKSTLLKILAGLLAPSDGTADLKSEPIAGPRRDIGVVFQTPVLFPWRTVLGNVMLPAHVQRLDREPMTRRALELLGQVGLGGFERRYPRELSGGMQQRVGIVRALLHDPAILLMDEPFSALDAMTREALAVELQRMWLQRRFTVLFITHSISEAVFLGDRVIVMTSRPGTIGDSFEVDLPRPRTLDAMTTERFGRYIARVRAALAGTGAA
jgi:NitT/TauT family transport system ATP-binding protein